MCRMLGVMCNDEDLLGCAVNEVSDSLRGEWNKNHDGVGVGYYQTDDPLLKKRPSSKMDRIDYSELVKGITATTLLIHIRQATVGAWKDVNTHPFRFRRWLFAHVGHLPGLAKHRTDIIKQLPPFLSRSIRGDTDSELAFCLVLADLFKDGALNDLDLDTEQLSKYLLSALSNINHYHVKTSRPPEFAMVITNGQIMAAVCKDVSMHYSHREGIQACAEHDDSQQQEQLHRRFKGIMIGAEMENPGHQWREVGDASLLTVTKSLELNVQSL